MASDAAIPGDRAALVLFSGGQDSATCLAWALDQFDHVETLGFDYGQRHRVELDRRAALRAGTTALDPAWAGGLGADGLRRVSDRLSLEGPERRRLLAWPETRRRLGRGLARRRASEIARRIAGLSADEIVAAASRLPGADRRALRAARSAAARAMPLPIRGADLVAAGVASGAAIGRALSRTRDALVDGAVSAEDALAFALRVARREAARG